MSYPATEVEVRGVRAVCSEQMRELARARDGRQGLVAIGIGLPSAGESSAHLYLAFADATASARFERGLCSLPVTNHMKQLIRSVPVQTSLVRAHKLG